MHFRSIRARIGVPYVVLILVAMMFLAFYLSGQLRQVRLTELESQLLADAHLMADIVKPSLGKEGDEDGLDQLTRRWADLLDLRVTIISISGEVLAESHEDRNSMDNHLFRPEVQQALKTGKGMSVRFSNTVSFEMMYVALPIMDGEPIGILRVSLPLDEVEADLGRVRQMVITAALITASVAVLFALIIAERTAQPVRRLTQVARRLAEGDLTPRLPLATHDELGQLTRAFNYMAERLRQQMSNQAREKGRLAAVLESMVDGVLITDEAGSVQLINPAAAWLLGTRDDWVIGSSIAQVVRHHQLIELWQRCRERGEEQVEAVEFSRHGLFLQVIVTPFQEHDDQGFLIILQDLTRIRRLETIRRDFVSNISHELRTPLAGLKALVDTLREGALADPPAAERFLTRMDAEVDTMTQMVQELLELSRLESGQAPLRMSPVVVADLLVPPIERLRPQAERAELDVQLILPRGLPKVLADAERVQQVLTNLLHNAIKFTPAGGTVLVSAAQQRDELLVSVRDTGVGIGVDDLPRIFERFFKADHARSGRGTGLGLAIAKHVVQGHGGRIWAESVEGRGSTFFFTLPIAQAN
jgi:two-component system phosphate regulon sensor histidine kinase PhoR